MKAIDHELQIPEEELRFKSSTSGGPGGQNVNRVRTRVTLSFDVKNSPSLSSRQREMILTRLSTRISKAGILRIVSQRHRTQAANRKEAKDRLAALLEKALSRQSMRIKTTVPNSARKRRLREKRLRSTLKKERSGKSLPEE